MRQTLIIWFGIFFAPALYGQTQAKPKNTYPVPPKVQPADPLRVFPAVQMPLNPEAYVWEVASTGDDAVPVFTLERGRRLAVGKVPVGQELVLSRMTRFGDRLYYAFYWDGSNFSAERTRTIVYLDGRFIKAKSLKKS